MIFTAPLITCALVRIVPSRLITKPEPVLTPLLVVGKSWKGDWDCSTTVAVM